MDDVTLSEVRRIIRRANFRLKSEENEAAFNLFKKALEYFPESIEIMNVLGALSIKQGNISEAIRYYRDSIVIKDNEKTQLELGFSLIRNNQVEEAYEIFSKLDNTKDEVQAGLGISLVLRNEQPRDAVNLLENLRDYDKDINVSTFLGLAYYQLGAYNKALNELRKNLASWKNTHAVGVQYFAMDSQQSARRYFMDAIEKYEEAVKMELEVRDESIWDKLNHDLILSEPNAQLRLSALLTLVDKGAANLETYLAIIGTQYELSSYDFHLAEYISRVKEFVNQDQVNLITQLDSWLEKTRGNNSG